MPTVGPRSTTNIALVYTGEKSLGSVYDAALIRGMSEGLDRDGYDLLVLSSSSTLRSGESLSQMLRRKGVRGAIVRTSTVTREWVHRLNAERFPFVVVADDFPEPSITSVTIDVDSACRRGLEHLIHYGHRRIAITLNLVDDHDHGRRLECWRSVLEDHGLEASDRLIYRVPAYPDAGAIALRQLISMPNRPTAVFCSDPSVAVGMCHEAQRTGFKIPDQLSVLGFDDTDQRYGTYPRLSAVCQDAVALGRAAYARLAQLMDNGSGDASTAVPPTECWFEPHESTGPAPGAVAPAGGDN